MVRSYSELVHLHRAFGEHGAEPGEHSLQLTNAAGHPDAVPHVAIGHADLVGTDRLGGVAHPVGQPDHLAEQWDDPSHQRLQLSAQGGNVTAQRQVEVEGLGRLHLPTSRARGLAALQLGRDQPVELRPHEAGLDHPVGLARRTGPCRRMGDGCRR
jgi:hypothetical protein